MFLNSLYLQPFYRHRDRMKNFEGLKKVSLSRGPYRFSFCLAVDVVFHFSIGVFGFLSSSPLEDRRGSDCTIVVKIPFLVSFRCPIDALTFYSRGVLSVIHEGPFTLPDYPLVVDLDLKALWVKRRVRTFPRCRSRLLRPHWSVVFSLTCLVLRSPRPVPINPVSFLFRSTLSPSPCLVTVFLLRHKNLYSTFVFSFDISELKPFR